MKRDKLFYEVIESQLKRAGFEATSQKWGAIASLTTRKLYAPEVEIALSEVLADKFEVRQYGKAVIVK